MTHISLRLFSAAATFGLVVCSATAAPADGPDLHLSFGDPAYTLANACNLARPLVFVNAVLRNDGTEPSPESSVTATDDQQTLSGTAPLPSIDAGAQLALTIGLSHAGAGPAGDVGGNHTIVLTAGDRSSDPRAVAIPSSLCGAPPAARPGESKLGHLRPRGTSPIFSEGTTAVSQRTAIVVAALRVASPTNVRSANGASDCAAHAGPLGALVCPDLVRSGHVLLIWDWQPTTGPDEIDGYYVYRVDGNGRQRVATQANKKSLTLSDVPPPPGGYAGACYAVSAYAGSRESAPSSAFCAGESSAARIARLAPTQTRSHSETFGVDRFATNDRGLYVGFSYTATKHLIGDTNSNAFSRAAVFFDIANLRGRRLVDAKLKLKIASTRGAGPVHSCATTVGVATGYWWQATDQIDADFGSGVPAGDTGPDVAIDVQRIVARWMRGEASNYGFVLRNDDENPGAFTNLECMTQYFDPILEVTYF
jgi:hypothetical protein